MERVRQQQKSFPDSLKATLNCYRLSSADSLGGPSGCSALAAQMWCKILTTVLKDFNISEINRACAELHIYCSRSSLDQLEILKVLGVLPFNTTQCGLISKSDAERLLSFLGVEFHVERKRDFIPGRTKGLPVYHECFGRGEGFFYSDLYVTPDSACISCAGCRMNFSPSKFVSHSHRGLEKRTCHWGFDRDHWRYYILIPDYIENSKYKDMEKELNRMKEKFMQSVGTSKSENHHRRSPNVIKRRIKTENEVGIGKRLKEEKPEFPSTATSNHYPGFPFVSRASAFKPWSSGLPPLIPNPPNLPMPHDDAILKAFGPLMRDRLNSVKCPQKVPNITLDPAERRQRAEDFALMKHRLREDALRRKQGLSGKLEGGFNYWNYHRTALPVKSEVAEVSYMKSHHRDVSDGVIERVFPAQSPRNLVVHRKEDDEPLELTKSSEKKLGGLASSAAGSSEDICSQVEEKDEENEIIDVTGDVDGAEKRLQNKPHAENTLSLSPRKSPHSIPQSSPPPHPPVSSSEVPPHFCASLRNVKYNHREVHPVPDVSRPSSPPSYPIVTSLDSSQYRWSFPSASYIISASGTKELRRLQSILDENYDEGKMCEILHEMTRIKWSSEETLAMKNKTLNDMKSELNRLRVSKDKDLEEARLATKQLRSEIDRMRTDFRSRINDATDSLVELGTKLSHPQHLEDVEQDAMQHKILERLHQQVNKKEDVIQVLEKQLLEEREHRMAAERRIDEVIDGSRGRILSFMTGPLRSAAPHLKTHIHSNPNGKHMITSSAKSPIHPHMEDPQSEDEAIDVGTPSGRPLCTSPSHSSSKDSGVHDV